MCRKSPIPRLALGIAIVATLIGCGQRELKVALIGSSQMGNAFVTALYSGAQMAIDEWNARGGVLGMKIVRARRQQREPRWSGCGSAQSD